MKLKAALGTVALLMFTNGYAATPGDEIQEVTEKFTAELKERLSRPPSAEQIALQLKTAFPTANISEFCTMLLASHEEQDLEFLNANLPIIKALAEELVKPFKDLSEITNNSEILKSTQIQLIPNKGEPSQTQVTYEQMTQYLKAVESKLIKVRKETPQYLDQTIEMLKKSSAGVSPNYGLDLNKVSVALEMITRNFQSMSPNQGEVRFYLDPKMSNGKILRAEWKIKGPDVLVAPNIKVNGAPFKQGFIFSQEVDPEQILSDVSSLAKIDLDEYFDRFIEKNNIEIDGVSLSARIRQRSRAAEVYEACGKAFVRPENPATKLLLAESFASTKELELPQWKTLLGEWNSTSGNSRFILKENSGKPIFEGVRGFRTEKYPVQMTVSGNEILFEFPYRCMEDPGGPCKLCLIWQTEVSDKIQIKKLYVDSDYGGPPFEACNSGSPVGNFRRL